MWVRRCITAPRTAAAVLPMPMFQRAEVACRNTGKCADSELSGDHATLLRKSFKVCIEVIEDMAMGHMLLLTGPMVGR